MTLSEILQFEKNTEAVMIGVMSDACGFVYHSRQTDTNQSPRITCKTIVGAQFQDQKLTIGVAPFYIYQCYECRMQVIVSTNRTTEETSGAHDDLLGQVRMRLSQYFVDDWQNTQLAISEDNVPNLVTQVKPAESDDDQADTENLDNTTLAISFILVINPAALTTLN
jgi:hypothetical protein